MRYTIAAAIFLALACHHSTAQYGRSEARDQSKEVVELVKLLARDDDVVGLERARWLLVTGKSPAEVLDPAQKSPGHIRDPREIPSIQRDAFHELAEFVRHHRFPDGLPTLPPSVNSQRLAPFFDYLVHYCRAYAGSSAPGATFESLFDESWLAAAEACGRREIGWFIDIHRGRLSDTIQRAEGAEDHLALGDIGRCMRLCPSAWESVPHATFQTCTLAWLLTGLHGSSGPFSEYVSAAAFLSWRDDHPGLLEDARHLMGDYPSLGFRVIDLWHRGRRAEAWDLLFPPDASAYW